MENKTIFEALRGSHSRKMATQESDLDKVAVVVAPEEFYFGFSNRDVWHSQDEVNDVITYEVGKYIRLLLGANPNVLESLWVDNEFVLTEDDAFRLLRSNRKAFISKAVYKTFSGYAKGQLDKMVTLTPEILDRFEFLESILINNGVNMQELNLNQEMRDKQIDYSSSLYAISTKFQSVLNEYLGLKKKYFSGGRLGAKRKALIKKLGYDTKDAMMLVLLYRQCIEMLSTGKLNVVREDRDSLFDIREGKYTIDEVKSMAADLHRQCDSALKASKLPEEPDKKFAERLAIDIIKRGLIN